MSSTLTTNQQFALAKYKLLVKEATREQLEEMFIEVLRQKYEQENAFSSIFISTI